MNKIIKIMGIALLIALVILIETLMNRFIPKSIGLNFFVITLYIVAFGVAYMIYITVIDGP